MSFNSVAHRNASNSEWIQRPGGDLKDKDESGSRNCPWFLG